MTLISNTKKILLLAAINVLSLSATDVNFPTSIQKIGENIVAISNKGKSNVDLIDVQSGNVIKSIDLKFAPTGLANNKDYLFVTASDLQGVVYIISLQSGTIEAEIPVGMGACSPVLSVDGSKLYVCNRYKNSVSEIDLSSKKVTRTVDVLREPNNIVFSNDGKRMFVTNFLPAQRADVDEVASELSVVNTSDFKVEKNIRLANGSNALRGMCVTPDGKYVYVSHNLGRFQVPTSQLQQGWMNTSAFSVIDAEKLEYLGAVLVDEPERGAAGVWDIVCDNDYIFITHSGTHEISKIDHKKFREKFESYPQKENLSYDLHFLYGMRERIPIEGNGPRAMIYANNALYIPTYFSDILNVYNVPSSTVKGLELNPDRVETNENKGERIFNDAMYCFQNWQSCNGCHPGEGRTDGMNWDLMNDGVGNPKNCKSLLLSHVTAPNMISGIRENAEIAVRAGFKFIQFHDVPEEDALNVDLYLKSLKPLKSPYLVDGELSEEAKKGRKVFEKLNCDACHSGPYFTDMKMHRIGDDIEFEKGWDTPTLIEVWRTAPYLFDGRAATLKSIFSEHKHGIKDKKVSDKEIDQLVEYVNSL